MSYTKDFQELQKLLLSPSAEKKYDSIELFEAHFNSFSFKILPGADEYFCETHQTTLKQNFSFYTDIGPMIDHLQTKDIAIKENQEFDYYLMKPAGVEKTSKVIFLFHGFNEKNWSKYLPWAKSLCDRTGSAVILFPIAFHMQRAPENWSSKKEMYQLSELRKQQFPNIINSTLSNVAISMRLHSMPQRFIWSGLQTFYDVIQLINEIRQGKHQHIQKDFMFDLVAYSIGGFLALILKLTNFDNLFANAKVGLFCSGATFNRLSPVSKFILDSEANVALYSFLIEHFDAILKKDNLLNHFINEDHTEGKIFYSMLDYHKMREFREELFKKFEKHIYAITLKKDTVIPSFEVVNTLKGAYRNINIRVDEIDFDRSYIHENPFPVNRAQNKINKDFEFVFSKIGDFLNQ
ncbi:MAG TPA: DUF6051 family protein [Bacteroidales bacterium]|nr:DUF6051 family protein [Bacteroidales bacterium]